MRGVAVAMKIDFFKGEVIRCRSGDLEKDFLVSLSEDFAIWFRWLGVTYHIDFIMVFPDFGNAWWQVYGLEFSVK